MKIEGAPRDLGQRSLSDAIRAGNVEQVKAQVGAADATAVIQGQYRRFGPVHEAVISPRAEEILPLLIAAGFDVNAYDSMGQTPLQWALNTAASDAVISVLIAQGANVHVRDNEEKTLLFSAALAGRLEFCRALIDAGVDVNAEDKAGWTALHIAALNEHVSICRLLIESGARSSYKPELVLDDYLTPFQTAVRFASVNAAGFFIAECGESLDQMLLDGRTLRDAVRSSINGRSTLTAIEVQTQMLAAARPESGAEAGAVVLNAGCAGGPL